MVFHGSRHVVEVHMSGMYRRYPLHLELMEYFGGEVEEETMYLADQVRSLSSFSTPTHTHRIKSRLLKMGNP